MAAKLKLATNGGFMLRKSAPAAKVKRTYESWYFDALHERCWGAISSQKIFSHMSTPHSSPSIRFGLKMRGVKQNSSLPLSSAFGNEGILLRDSTLSFTYNIREVSQLRFKRGTSTEYTL
ncbi:uncharacterized protein BDCG_02689 [Blastomyces dermatitidis ER-3]|uniref:Uncharacterized protein n=1 Tax=Ajellomyces dermatitidis (strain ER-3 / ATCC MYA-2586) TaxID=559297 RepID=A0ABP2EUH6_AJEDR|nr:uncharacterized protein BDCG_02689 [Blastomyces dermatitidis ER-3]EEQ87569.1 hypothetical protein BDCG_02689 [Blastomyces dermatitidis ER-3]